jgi:hypothetical protein
MNAFLLSIFLLIYHSIPREDDKLIGSIATALTITASSEACLEKGFLFLTYILTTRRRKLGENTLENTLCIRESTKR